MNLKQLFIIVMMSNFLMLSNLSVANTSNRCIKLLNSNRSHSLTHSSGEVPLLDVYQRYISKLEIQHGDQNTVYVWFSKFIQKYNYWRMNRYLKKTKNRKIDVPVPFMYIIDWEVGDRLHSFLRKKYEHVKEATESKEEIDSNINLIRKEIQSVEQGVLNYVKQSHENAVKIANIEIELKYLKSALVFAGLGHYRNIIKFNRENTFDKDFTALASEAQLFLPVPKLVSKSTGKTWTEFEVEVVNANSRPATEKNELLFKYYSTILAKYQRLKQERKKLLNLEFEIQYQYAQGIQRLHYTMLSTHRWVKSYKHSTEALTSVDKLVLDELNLEFNRMLNILNELKKPLLKAQNYLSAKVKESERLTHSNNAIDAKKKSNMLDEIFFSRLKKTLGIDFTSDSKGEITSKMDGFVRNQIDTFLQTHGTSLKELTPKNAKGPLDYFYNFVKVRIGTVALVSLLSTAGVTGYGKAVGVENVNPEKDLKLPTLVLESVKEFYSQKFNEDKLRIQEIQQRNGLNREQGIKELAEYMVNVVKADEERSLRAVEWYDQFHLDYFHKIMFESLESKKQEAIAAKEKKKIAILETKMKAHNNQELSLDEEMIRIATQVITLRGEVDSETNMIKKAQLLEKRKKEVNKQIANVMQWFEKRYGERVKGVSPEAVELRANLQELITNLYKTKSELKTMSINNVDTGEHNVNMNFIEIKINKINDPEIKQSATRFVYLIIGSHKIMYSQFNKGVFDEVIANLIKVADPDNLTGLVDFATEVLLPSTGQ